MIKEYLFGLIECYSEVGYCRMGSFSFNPTWSLIIYDLIGIGICFLIYLFMQNDNKRTKKRNSLGRI